MSPPPERGRACGKGMSKMRVRVCEFSKSEYKYMKANMTFVRIALAIALMTGMGHRVAAQDGIPVGGSADPVLSAPVPGLPYIHSIEVAGGEVVVHVAVPEGVRKVTLESRTRLGAGTWIPRAVQRVEGAGELTIRLARSENLEMLRVRGDAQEPLPASFYQGKTNFSGQASAYDSSGLTYLRGGVVDTTVPSSATGNAETARTVVESDIWFIRGQTLYFFNQYRGLQIVDLTQPDAPVLRAHLDLAAVGEQMYVPDDDHVVLLVQNSSSNTGQALVVDVRGEPKVLATLSVDGSIQESRMVGTVLYIASQAYRQASVPPKGDPNGTSTPSSEWQWGSVVTSFDLASLEAPVKRDTLWYAGYNNVITATDKYLLVAIVGNDYWTSTLEIIDISAPEGTMRQVGKLQPAGRVADKFKMNLSQGPDGGDVLAVISEVSGTWQTPNTQRKSVLQTFSLADPSNPAKLGYIEVGHGEGLYATRFDGDRAYIVTFLRMDPLWIVDLKDPAQPRLLGELQVPGWSTYMYPMGDRLVAIGIDNSNSWKVAVSLFDVSDPAKPGLLAKVPLGEQSSWSEANHDEKAFTVLPDAGLIMVPYQGWASNNWASRVQLIDFSRDSLKARGVIEHTMQPRRATALNDRIVSISGTELLVVDAKDRDNPVTKAALELSWGVNRVFAYGNYVVEIEDASYWGPNSNPMIRVVQPADLGAVRARLELTNGFPVLGACARDARLYVLQGNAGYVGPVYAANGEKDPTQPETPAPNLFLSVFDLAVLPEIKLLGQTQAVVTNSLYGSNLTPVWPRSGLLVWTGSGGGWWGGLMRFDTIARPGLWWGGGGAGRLVAFNVADATTPQLASDLSLTSTNAWWSFSPAFSADGLVYVSHQASEFLPGVTLPDQAQPQPVVTRKEDGTFETNIPPVGIYVTRYYLDVVDYADAINPTPRKPVNLPAQLVGLSRQGALLYTKGPRWDDKWQTDWTDYLAASAYDGVQVSLVDTVRMPTNAWSSGQPAMLNDGTVLVALNQYEATSSTSLVQAWQLNEGGKLVNVASHKLDATISNIRVWGALLAAQLNQSVELYSIANLTDWLPMGSGATGYYWSDLSNADGNLEAGLFVPLGVYGVLAVQAKSKP